MTADELAATVEQFLPWLTPAATTGRAAIAHHAIADALHAYREHDVPSETQRSEPH